MPKYFKNKVCGYYLYYTSFCLVECMHDSPTKSLFRPPDFNFKYLFRKNDHQRRTFGICDNSERFFFNFIETFVYFIFQLFPR